MLICHHSFCLVALEIQRPSSFETEKNNTWVPIYLKINKFNIPTIETIEKMLIIFVGTFQLRNKNVYAR